MHYLLLAIISSSAIALILKRSESRNLNRLAVTGSNYAVATAISLIFVLERRLLTGAPLSFPLFRSEFHKLFHGGLFSEGASLVWAVVTGFIGGILYYFGLIAIQKSIKENGVCITGAFSKIGIFIPMSLAIIVWKEIPTAVQWLGIVLAMAAISLVHFRSVTGAASVRCPKSLIMVFLVVGLAEFSNKFFQHYAIIEHKPLFLFTVFLIAFSSSLVAMLRERTRLTGSDILTGILVGIPNMFTSFFLIEALSRLKTAVVFPAFSAGTIVVINIGGLIFFKEQLKRRELAAIFLTIGAVALMGL